jgi:hypothetical protein
MNKKKEENQQCNISKLIALIILLVIGSYGYTLVSYGMVSSKADRVVGVEAKLDLLLNHFGIKK